MPFISTSYIIKFPLKLGGQMKTMDQGWSEFFGSSRINNSIKSFSQFYQVIHNNNIKLYLLRFTL